MSNLIIFFQTKQSFPAERSNFETSLKSFEINTFGASSKKVDESKGRIFSDSQAEILGHFEPVETNQHKWYLY